MTSEFDRRLRMREDHWLDTFNAAVSGLLATGATSSDGAFELACRIARGAPLCKCGNRSTHLCDYPLRGSKAGQTCSARLCASCAVRVAPNADYCRPHVRLANQEDTKP